MLKFVADVERRCAALAVNPPVVVVLAGGSIGAWYLWKAGRGANASSLDAVLATLTAIEAGAIKIPAKKKPPAKRWDVVEDYTQMKKLQPVATKHGLTRERVRQILNGMGIDTKPQKKAKLCAGCGVTFVGGGQFCGPKCPAKAKRFCDPKIYRAWQNMTARCRNQKNPEWASYGGRGIKVCELWKKDFEAFQRHMGPSPSPKHSIDRINNDGNYEPGNMRWATRKEQANNRRRGSGRTSERIITANGQTRSLAEWAEATGIKPNTIWSRIKARGWSPEKALSAKVKS